MNKVDQILDGIDVDKVIEANDNPYEDLSYNALKALEMKDPLQLLQILTRLSKELKLGQADPVDAKEFISRIAKLQKQAKKHNDDVRTFRSNTEDELRAFRKLLGELGIGLRGIDKIT